MLWLRDYSCFGMMPTYQAEAQKACSRKASWRKGPSGLILNDNEGYQQSDSNSNAPPPQLSVEIHDVHLLWYPLCCVCFTPVIREMDNHLMPESSPVPTCCLANAHPSERRGASTQLYLGVPIFGQGDPCWSLPEFFLEEEQESVGKTASSSEFMGQRSLKGCFFKGRLCLAHWVCLTISSQKQMLKPAAQLFRISKVSSSGGGTQKTPWLFT